MAQTIGFDSFSPGALPPQWVCGVTGSGGNGRRNTIKYVDAPVAKNAWHTLRVDFAGTSIKVSLNGKIYIDVHDNRITGGGAVGMWTKADSVTAFDDFTFSAVQSKPTVK